MLFNTKYNSAERGTAPRAGRTEKGRAEGRSLEKQFISQNVRKTLLRLRSRGLSDSALKAVDPKDDCFQVGKML